MAEPLAPLGSIWGGEPTRLDQLPDMEALFAEVRGCNACRLRTGCSGVVFGEGVPGARLMCIGLAQPPGPDPADQAGHRGPAGCDGAPGGGQPGCPHHVWTDFKAVISRYRELVDPNHHSPYP